MKTFGKKVVLIGDDLYDQAMPLQWLRKVLLMNL